SQCPAYLRPRLAPCIRTVAACDLKRFEPRERTSQQPGSDKARQRSRRIEAPWAACSVRTTAASGKSRGTFQPEPGVVSRWLNLGIFLGKRPSRSIIRDTRSDDGGVLSASVTLPDCAEEINRCD